MLFAISHFKKNLRVEHHPDFIIKVNFISIQVFFLYDRKIFFITVKSVLASTYINMHYAGGNL